MTEPKQDYRSYVELAAVRSTCSICGDPSPVVYVERTPNMPRERVPRNFRIRAQLAELIRDHGWEIDLKKDKAVCPSCRRIGQ